MFERERSGLAAGPLWCSVNPPSAGSRKKRPCWAPQEAWKEALLTQHAKAKAGGSWLAQHGRIQGSSPQAQ